MTVIERLQQQVNIRGTSSPFGALAADALAEIAVFKNALWRACGDDASTANSYLESERKSTTEIEDEY